MTPCNADSPASQLTKREYIASQIMGGIVAREVNDPEYIIQAKEAVAKTNALLVALGSKEMKPPFKLITHLSGGMNSIPFKSRCGTVDTGSRTHNP